MEDFPNFYEEVFEQLLSIEEVIYSLGKLTNPALMAQDQRYAKSVIPLVINKVLPEALERLCVVCGEEPVNKCYIELFNSVQLASLVRKYHDFREPLTRTLLEYRPRMLIAFEKLLCSKTIRIHRTEALVSRKSRIGSSWIPSTNVIGTLYRTMINIEVGKQRVSDRVTITDDTIQVCKDFGALLVSYFESEAPGITKKSLEILVPLLIERVPIDDCSCQLFDLFVPLGIDFVIRHPFSEATAPSFRYDRERGLLIGNTSTVAVVYLLDGKTQKACVKISVDTCIDPKDTNIEQWYEEVFITPYDNQEFHTASELAPLRIDSK
jgi:hypothetical protein